MHLCLCPLVLSCLWWRHQVVVHTPCCLRYQVLSHRVLLDGRFSRRSCSFGSIRGLNIDFSDCLALNLMPLLNTVENRILVPISLLCGRRFQLCSGCNTVAPSALVECGRGARPHMNHVHRVNEWLLQGLGRRLFCGSVS